MIVRASQRGGFVGAQMYFLRDKHNTHTNERVEWTMTLNTSSDDADKAIREMRWTSDNAEYIKQLVGGSRAGRKSSGLNCWQFSLSWHPEQEPEKKHMVEAAQEALKVQKLDHHQCVLISHSDSEYKHVHVLVNLVDPSNGKVNVVSMGKRKFSEWAQEYEEKDGRIYCPQRQKNNELRKENDGKPRHERKRITYQEKPIKFREELREAYDRCDDVAELKKAIEELGYTLSEGRKGRMVLIDRHGHTSNLVRQLDGVRTKDVRNKFQGIEGGQLEKAEMVVRRINEAMSYDNEQERVNMANRELDAADHHARNESIIDQAKPSTRITPFYEEVDAAQQWERAADMKRRMLEQGLAVQYRRAETVKKLETMQKLLASTTRLDKLRGRDKEIAEQVERLQMNLDNIDQRIAEKRGELESWLESTKPEGLRNKERNAQQEKKPDVPKPPERRQRPPDREHGL